MDSKFDKKVFLEYINKNKSTLLIEDVLCLSGLYKTYEMINRITNGNYEENKPKLLRYEDYIYTFNGKIIANKVRIELELKKLTKKTRTNETLSIVKKEEIVKEIQKLYELAKDEKYTDYIKKRISIIQSILGIENTFFCASYELFVEIYDQVINKSVDIDKKEYKHINKPIEIIKYPKE